jgi:hypothetical protein
LSEIIDVDFTEVDDSEIENETPAYMNRAQRRQLIKHYTRQGVPRETIENMIDMRNTQVNNTPSSGEEAMQQAAASGFNFSGNGVNWADIENNVAAQSAKR